MSNPEKEEIVQFMQLMKIPYKQKNEKLNNDVVQYVQMLKKDIKDLQHKHDRIDF